MNYATILFVVNLKHVQENKTIFAFGYCAFKDGTEQNNFLLSHTEKVTTYYY